MIPTLLALLPSAQDAEGTAGTHESLRLLDLPAPWVTVLVILPLFALVTWIGYAREHIPSATRAVLCALRMGAFLLLFVVDWPAESTEGIPRMALKALSLPAHFEGFAKGNVASVDVAYFLSLAALGLFAARTAIASQRWR